MKALPIAALCLTSLFASLVAEPLNYFLPDNEPYDAAIAPPEEFLGFEIGEWHVRHDPLLAYMDYLAKASPRVRIETIGRTHERRRLVHLTISSPDNHDRMNSIREEHLDLCNPESEREITDAMPVVVNLSYSVHGNESSGANASLAVAYYLAASQGEFVKSLLKSTVIILDPALNPDGLSRFAQWANMHRGKSPVGDDVHREHQETWPGGRTNHYWFDLNRDWLLVQHPESKARIRQFHRWRPNVLADFHEMGSNSTFFFQPGVPQRRHPLTPERNVEITAAIADHHAAALDELGILYFTQERYDDFYYGKGSTYPDIHGGIGILFEQASSRGHRRETDHGEMDFAFTIRNQVRTSLSTLRGALEQRADLLQWQREFYQSSAREADNDAISGYVFGQKEDPARNAALIDVLLRHQIEVRELAQPVLSHEQEFEPGYAWIVSLKQPQYRLIKAIWERRTEFPDSIFYDISAWTLPLAMNIPFKELTYIPESFIGPVLPTTPPPKSFFNPSANAVAYAIEWHSFHAPKALYQLLKSEIKVLAATKPFQASTPNGRKDLDYGTLVIPMSPRQSPRKKAEAQLRRVADANGLIVHNLTSGLTPTGIDLGSPNLRPLEQPKPALVVGKGISAYEAGEVWHLLDDRLEMSLPLIDIESFDSAEIRKYTHLILVNGNYNRLSENSTNNLKRWITEGGVLIALRNSIKWAKENKIVDVSFAEDPRNIENSDSSTTNGIRHDYADFAQTNDSWNLNGAIFEADVDNTHPIGYGYVRRELPIFRNSRLFIDPDKNPYGTVVRLIEEPLLAGYIHEEDRKRIGGTASVIVQRKGEGCVILMADNPNFRAFWIGTMKLFVNSLFFGDIVDRTME